jgi:hypothetical protein
MVMSLLAMDRRGGGGGDDFTDKVIRASAAKLGDPDAPNCYKAKAVICKCIKFETESHGSNRDSSLLDFCR